MRRKYKNAIMAKRNIGSTKVASTVREALQNGAKSGYPFLFFLSLDNFSNSPFLLICVAREYPHFTPFCSHSSF
jgi:hypothetical protein